MGSCSVKPEVNMDESTVIKYMKTSRDESCLVLDKQPESQSWNDASLDNSRKNKNQIKNIIERHKNVKMVIFDKTAEPTTQQFDNVHEIRQKYTCNSEATEILEHGATGTTDDMNETNDIHCDIKTCFRLLSPFKKQRRPRTASAAEMYEPKAKIAQSKLDPTRINTEDWNKINFKKTSKTSGRKISKLTKTLITLTKINLKEVLAFVAMPLKMLRKLECSWS